MTTRATAVNPDILVWARERAGLSIAEVAARLDRPLELVEAWEAGESWPTYNQLETLAETVYHRPVALFFLPSPPKEASAQEEFRTLPDFDVAGLAADTRFAVRLARAHQQSLRELTGGSNPAETLITRILQPRGRPTPVVAKDLRGHLGVSLQDQLSWPNSNEMAMTRWRDAVERVGVFVFKRSFKQREISGFCLPDAVFPVIMVNNSAPFTRQIFTLFHELAHLLYGVASITTEDESLVDRLPIPARHVEVLCNQLAAELLMPAESFPWAKISIHELDQSVALIAARYKVSREAVLRRLLDKGLVDQATYEERAKRWAAEAATRGESGGGNYYSTQVAYLGRNFLDLAFSRQRAGLVQVWELAEHLGVKAKNIQKLEDRVYSRG
jgi:Zn-dependent peptidase ImmA (M78 family)/transcriptional regulator with XRE-family HTH domain